MSLLTRFRNLDVYRDLPRDLTEPTLIGASVSVLCGLVTLYLFISELLFFLTPETTHQFFIDNRDHSHPGAEDHLFLRINMNISLPAVPCAVLSVDAQDSMGAHVVDVAIAKTRLVRGSHPPYFQRVSDRKTELLVPGKSAIDHAVDEDAIEQKGEGCNFHGTMTVKRVPGNWHISAHSRQHLLQQLFGQEPMNLTHYIHSISFGEHGEDTFAEIENLVVNPLSGSKKIVTEHKVGEGRSFEYWVKIVPMMYEKLNGQTIDSFQYVSNSNTIVGGYAIPAIYFRYELSPITVKYAYRAKSFSHFVVQLCAIIGGVFTVLGLFNSVVRSSLRHFVEKARQNKLG